MKPWGFLALFAILAGHVEAQAPPSNAAAAWQVNGVNTNAAGIVSVPVFTDGTATPYVPACGATVSIPSTVGTAFINPTGACLTMTIQLPVCSSTFNGQYVHFNSSQTLTTLTMTTAGGSLLGALTTLLGNGFATYSCDGSSTTWKRVG